MLSVRRQLEADHFSARERETALALQLRLLQDQHDSELHTRRSLELEISNVRAEMHVLLARHEDTQQTVR